MDFDLLFTIYMPLRIGHYDLYSICDMLHVNYVERYEHLFTCQAMRNESAERIRFILNYEQYSLIHRNVG